MSYAGVGPLGFLKKTVLYQDILEYLMLSPTDKLHEDADFIFHQDLAPPTPVGSLTDPWWGESGWVSDQVTRKHAWTEQYGKPVEYLQEEDERHQTQLADDLKRAITMTWASITLHQSHRQISSMPCHHWYSKCQLVNGRDPKALHTFIPSFCINYTVINVKSPSHALSAQKWTYLTKLWHFFFLSCAIL